MNKNYLLMKSLKRILFLLVLLFTHYCLFAQTCNGNTFNSPGAPTICTFTYIASNWDITHPSNINRGEFVGILANNSTTSGTYKGNMNITEGVIYFGTISSKGNSAKIVMTGTATTASL